MDAEREIQSVLRCGLCNKPFNKRAFTFISLLTLFLSANAF